MYQTQLDFFDVGQGLKARCSLLAFCLREISARPHFKEMLI